MMGDGFKDRVDKVFGSISSSSSSSSSSWSLSDAQVERREWKRDDERDDDRIPASSSFKDDDWDIRSSIGLDSTLDHEEEEDSFDKMAQGTDNCSGGDLRLYMKDVTQQHALFLNAHNVLLLKKGLKEDDDDDDDDDMLNGVTRIKSILKRKIYDDEAPKPAKRVKFDSACKNADAPRRPQGIALPGNRPSVPDYVLNPSKYTHYTFDDDCSHNSEAYLEKSSTCGGVEDKPCAELLPKSLVFIPRKKRGDAGSCNSKQSSTIVGIAAAQGEFSEMQEDDAVSRSQKPVRQYRSKMEGGP